MNKVLLSIFLFTFFSLPAQNKIELAYDNFQNSDALKGAYFGVSIIDIKTGNSILSKNDRSFFYPASVQKTITTAAALQLLGPDFRFETKVYYTGEIEGSVLKGALIIEGSGDPTVDSEYLSNDFLNQVLVKLKALGIKSIEGEILFDNDQNAHNTPATWLYEDIGNYYGVGAQLFNYKDNMYSLEFRQKEHNQTPTIEKISVSVPYTFKLNLKCSADIKGDHAFIMGAPFSEQREVIGTIGAGTGTIKIKGANSQPYFSFIADLKKSIPFKESPSVKVNRKLLLSVKSQSLSKLITSCNHESLNLFAEAILNSLGLNFHKSYTTENGILVLEDFVRQVQMNGQEIRIKDGSGLSRLNAMSPNFAAEWMCHFYENKEFVSSLPKAGETGTMRYMNNAVLKGKVQAKSGSAEGVVNYAGYITKSNGEVLAFSIFVNNAYQSKTSIRREIGAFLESCL